MTLDELDMADGATGTEIAVEFNYDGLNIQPGQDIREFTNLQQSTSVGEYPIAPRFAGDEPTLTSPNDTNPATATSSIDPEALAGQILNA